MFSSYTKLTEKKNETQVFLAHSSQPTFATGDWLKAFPVSNPCLFLTYYSILSPLV